jgi:hypothetical protein
MNPYDPRVIGAVGSAAHGIATDVGAAAAGGANAFGSGINLNGLLLVGFVALAVFAFKK